MKFVRRSCVLPVNALRTQTLPPCGVSVGQGAPTPNTYLETTTRVTGSTLKKPRVLHHKTPGLMEHLRGEHSTGATVVREQERFLPVANISRIMKKALPANAKIAKDAKETVQECVSEFISFVTSE